MINCTVDNAFLRLLVLYSYIHYIMKNEFTKAQKVDYVYTLQQEFELSYKLVRKGFGELQKIEYVNDFYFLPLLLLGQGIERFLKSYIIAYRIDAESMVLLEKQCRTHDLLLLLEIIQKNFYKIGHRSIDNEDCQFLSNNVTLKRVLTILSDFGNNGKYYNINHLLNGNASSPISWWEDLESDLIPLFGTIDYTDIKTVDFRYKEANNRIIVTIEKFLSILSRQHIFGNKSKVFCTAIISNYSYFERLYDGHYGKTDYTKL